MKLQWANFKFGGVPVYPEDGEGVTPPSNPQAPDINSTKNIRFQPNTGVWYKYTTNVNPCSSKESVTASMQMKLQPVSDDQNFWTNKCGTDDFINFQIIGTDGDEGNPDLNGTADNTTAPTTPKAPKTKSPSSPKKTKSPSANPVIAKPGAGDELADKPKEDTPSAKKSKSPNASKSPKTKSPTVGKGGKGSVERKRRRATSRRTPVRA